MASISSKIKEDWRVEDDKLIIKKTHDATQMLKDVSIRAKSHPTRLAQITNSLGMLTWRFLQSG